MHSFILDQALVLRKTAFLFAFVNSTSCLCAQCVFDSIVLICYVSVGCFGSALTGEGSVLSCIPLTLTETLHIRVVLVVAYCVTDEV